MTSIVKPWTFLTSHGHVFIAVATDPTVLVADLAARVDLTPRATLSVLKDLVEAGYVERTKVGRRTEYAVRQHRPFRHPADTGHEVDELVSLFAGRPPRSRCSPGRGDGPGRWPSPPPRRPARVAGRLRHTEE